jgi:hypothetical protein
MQEVIKVKLIKIMREIKGRSKKIGMEMSMRVGMIVSLCLIVRKDKR